MEDKNKAWYHVQVEAAFALKAYAENSIELNAGPFSQEEALRLSKEVMTKDLNQLTATDCMLIEIAADFTRESIVKAMAGRELKTIQARVVENLKTVIELVEIQ